MSDRITEIKRFLTGLASEQYIQPIAKRFLLEAADLLESPRDWTPCAEGLPEDGNYDVTIKSESGKLFIELNALFDDGEWYTEYDGGAVIAWMPKIDPYNPDRKEDVDRIVDANKKIDQVCPKCKSITHFDPHFARVVCRQCGWTQEDADNGK